ncbi:MAG: hypothetical protein U1E08_00460 [Coriobacteriia bacterium]|nr:hypothetical protein [Coriobacteriia bacterium]
MKWQDLTPVQRGLLVACGVVLLVAIIAGAFALGRGSADEAPATDEPTGTVEPTPTAEADEPAEPVAEPEPAPAPEPEPAPAPAPAPTSDRVFGLLKGVRDESGGAWADLRLDIDEAEFLTGQAALDWLTSQGDEEFYSPAYWYAKNTSVAVSTYPARPSPGPAVWMYTWPMSPAPGFYGPGMSKQVVEFGIFYDRIYMYDDADGLLDRCYWFTLDNDRVTLIEEQPRDPYYEP